MRPKKWRMVIFAAFTAAALLLTACTSDSGTQGNDSAQVSGSAGDVQNTSGNTQNVSGTASGNAQGAAGTASGNAQGTAGTASGDAQGTAGNGTGNTQDASGNGSGSTQNASGTASGDAQGTAGNGTGNTQDASGTASGDAQGTAGNGSGSTQEAVADQWEGTYVSEEERVTVKKADEDTISFSFAQSGISGTADIEQNQAVFKGDDYHVVIFSLNGTVLTVSVTSEEDFDASDSPLNGTYILSAD